MLQFSEHRKNKHPDMWFSANCYSCYPCQCLTVSYKDTLKHKARVNKTANPMFDEHNEINQHSKVILKQSRQFHIYAIQLFPLKLIFRKYIQRKNVC